MKTDVIRKKFLDFFASKNHEVIESDSLVPKDDPTVLFTTAGMQQFKRQFLGNIDGYTRAATSQKCLRTDDLNEVGQTDFHHTFFEMLGNFSFGDYFKKEAIHWAWEFLTKELGIPENRLCVSVYHEDQEAYDIWKEDIKIDPKKIFKLGGKSNFWPSNAKENGPNGPCGPCSEIFYDFSPEKGTYPKDPDDEPGRFSEVWNLVFTQYNRQEDGSLKPLPNKNIDTGMGLERLSAVLQGKKNNFEIDIFAPILKQIDEICPKLELKDKRIIADHMRAIVFGINDGVQPSNEGRGYVIKKLIIDITDKVVQAGETKPTVYKLVDAVVAAMKSQYPQLTESAKNTKDIIQNIENSYIKVRKERLPEFAKKAKENQDPQYLGELIFSYRDTYGLAINTIEKSLSCLNLEKNVLDQVWDIFHTLMKKQQEQSRKASKMTGDVFTDNNLSLDVPKTDFLGYDQAFSTSSVLRIFVDDKSVNVAEKGNQIKIILDKTPFYAESGGQIADTGHLYTEKGSVIIEDTQKIDDVFIHVGVIEEGSVRVGDIVKAEIDIARRLAIMCNHTATHIMQAALREVLGGQIKQQGSLVAEDRLRFDFTHSKAITADELNRIEEIVNINIRECDTITQEFLPIEEARKSGALAFFAEKYGKIVRVVSIGDYSKEFCGGTHLNITGQIGLFKITSESAIAQGIRRIEARTGSCAQEYIRNEEKTLNELSKVLKSPVNELVERSKQQSEKLKRIEKDFDELKFEAIKTAIVAGLDKTEMYNGINVFKKSFTNVEMNVLRKISDFIKKKLPASIIILGTKSKDNVSVLISSSDEAIKKGYKANELIQEVAKKIDGSGGGRPQLAQAGGKNTAKLDEAIDQVNKLLKKGE